MTTPSEEVKLPEPSEKLRCDAIGWEARRYVECHEQGRGFGPWDVQDAFIAGALQAVLEERERCAKCCEEWGAMFTDSSPVLEQAADCCAAAIRTQVTKGERG